MKYILPPDETTLTPAGNPVVGDTVRFEYNRTELEWTVTISTPGVVECNDRAGYLVFDYMGQDAWKLRGIHFNV